MQLPDTTGPSGDGNASTLLDSFLRGNRDDQARKPEGSILQALNLMNGQTISDAVEDPNGRVAKLVSTVPDDKKLIEEIYLAAMGIVLRVHPGPVERVSEDLERS